MRVGGREQVDPGRATLTRALNHLTNARSFRLAAGQGDDDEAVALFERVAVKHALAARDLLQEACPPTASRSFAQSENRSWAPRRSADHF